MAGSIMLYAALLLAGVLVAAGLALEIAPRLRGRGWSLERVRRVMAAHPLPAVAWIETGCWLLLIVPLLDHAFGLWGSTTGQVVWFLTIGPHEIGHVLCIPFGEFLAIAGGSIWQVLFWLLPGLWALLARRQIMVPLLLWTVAGHSLINLAVYVGDARTRALPLLFGLGEDAHDWWNLLRMTGLLEADHTLAVLAGLSGVALVLACIAGGVLTTWLVPRLGLGRRF
ncbi:MAG: hypothetical protein JW910_11495 [Anaerolineae bacterium]|nr:hypothetical protein [Anaerolineae bacterium]